MTVLAFAMLVGCTSTQQQAARARLRSMRVLASQVPTVVRGRDHSGVHVAAVAVLPGPAGTAITVRLRSSATRPLNDLPISVGILGRRGHRIYLNAGANLDYFETHLASIGARGSATWVFTTTRRLPASAIPFALVGARGTLPETTVRTLPEIGVAAAGSPRTSAGGARLRVRITNLSPVPQYQLQVYAIGLERGRYVAAGRATVSDLGAGSSETLDIGLLGHVDATSVELEALPTMFE